MENVWISIVVWIIFEIGKYYIEVSGIVCFNVVFYKVYGYNIVIFDRVIFWFIGNYIFIYNLYVDFVWESYVFVFGCICFIFVCFKVIFGNSLDIVFFNKGVYCVFFFI